MLYLCEGQVIPENERCGACNGKKTIKESKVFEIHVDKGMVDGQKIPLRGEADQMVENSYIRLCE